MDTGITGIYVHIVHLVPDANVHTDAGDDGDGEDNDFNAVVLINGCHDVIILLVQYFYCDGLQFHIIIYHHRLIDMCEIIA